MILLGENILIISNEPWSEIWFSKHHYAWELSKKGNQVYFVNPAPKWNWRNLFKSKISSRKINDNLIVLDYLNFLPSFFLTFNNKVVSKRIARYLRDNKVNEVIFWSFDPIRLFEPKLLNAKWSIFHVMDKYQFVHPAEFKLHQNVDCFILVSNSFESQYKNYGKPMLVLPHAISKDEFVLDDKEQNEIKLPFNSSQYGCYVGNIDVRVDFELVKRMAIEFPQIPFVFVGSWKNLDDTLAKEIFEKNQLKNIFLVGPKPSKLLKYYISKSTFCIAPMSQTHLGNNISHHKIFQYLAWGKPVFSIEFSEYAKFENLLYMNNDSDNTIRKMKEFVLNGEASDVIEKRIALTKELTFDNHFSKIENFLTEIGKK